MFPIPVVINNRNRLTTTKNMVEHLQFLIPNTPIIIIDNGSTYPPLLSWYQSIKNKVDIRMNKNEGYLALWATGLYKELPEYFIYTDSDIELNVSTPIDYQEIMFNLMERYNMEKIALALKVDDLPAHYRYKNQVIRNEGRWWLNQVEPDVYEADTDTTFAMMKNTGDNTYKSLRLARKDLIAKHVGWYLNLNNLDAEEQYYLDNHDAHFLTQYTKQHKNPENFNDV